MQNKVQELLNRPLVVINVGLKQFSDNLKVQDVEVVQVDWVPPAGGDKDMLDLLDRLL